MDKIREIMKDYIKEFNFKVGDAVRVHTKIVEGDTERIQVFDGIIIAIRGSGPSKTFTVRKVSYGVGVERIFPVNSPKIEKIELVKSYKVRRAKLNYLKELSGKAARLKERENIKSQETLSSENSDSSNIKTENKETENTENTVSN